MATKTKKKTKTFKLWERPALEIQTTTLWDYPSQHYGLGEQGSKHYKGATPSYIIWNLLRRYTTTGDTVLDPMCGSGTTIDVCKDLKRAALGFDLVPCRADIKPADARHLPIKSKSIDFIFIDPPYSDHIEYSDHPKCIGHLDAHDPQYYQEMNFVFKELQRVLKDERYIALYVCDSFKKGQPFCAIGFQLFNSMTKYFAPIDIICVKRHNRTLKRSHWHQSAVEGNYFLRGFNYLFIMKKSQGRVEKENPG